MKHQKAHQVVKYLKLKRSDPSIKLKELAYKIEFYSEVRHCWNNINNQWLK